MNYRFYSATDYPLAPFNLENLPPEMAKVLNFLNTENNYCIRGGAAYLLLTGCSDVLTDLDILAPIKSKYGLIESITKFAYEFYLNKNTNNQDVLTLFWPTKCNYFKLDILFSDLMPDSEYRIMKIAGKENFVPVVSGPWLWANKLQKISRKYPYKKIPTKIYNHAQIVIDLGKWLLRSERIIFPKFINKYRLIEYGNQAKACLESGIDGFDFKCFNEIVDQVFLKSTWDLC